MSKRKYLVLFRSQPTGASAQTGPSPEQMQQMFAAYKTWMEKFKDDILDMGDKLKSDGRVVTAFYAKRTTLYDGYQLAAFTWDPVKTLAEVK